MWAIVHETKPFPSFLFLSLGILGVAEPRPPLLREQKCEEIGCKARENFSLLIRMRVAKVFQDT
jgi:hypothetical protein